MRRRYIETTPFLSSVISNRELYAYSTDTDRTYQSALSFMTGLYPAGGPKLLWQNQTAFAKPPIKVDKFDFINDSLNMAALQNNFQTVPIHSDAGDMNSMLFQGHDEVMCPIIGEIQLFELSNKTLVNQTFSNYAQTLYPILKSKL